eukprot:6172353-Pleurochrysis_carterae.AAC.2
MKKIGVHTLRLLNLPVTVLRKRCETLSASYVTLIQTKQRSESRYGDEFNSPRSSDGVALSLLKTLFRQANVRRTIFAAVG